MTFGTVTNDGESASIRFERTIAASIEAVWNAVTNESELTDWLAPTVMEATLGGNIRIDFGEGGVVDGVISTFDPPHTIEYTWSFTGERDSIVRFELQTVATGTALVLQHTLMPPAASVGYGAGWHAYLDRLAATVGDDTPIDWDERFDAVMPHYTSQ